MRVGLGGTSFGSYAKKKYRYNGKEKDEESGLYYYGMRYYATWMCRFVSVDPLAADYRYLTPYQYASNNPIKNIDLDGLKGVSVHSGAKSISQFMGVLRKWDTEASKLKYRNVEQVAVGGPEVYSYYKPKNEAKLRIFAHDITADKQIINSVGSYNGNFGKFINAGLPLDLKHFMNYANLAYSAPDKLVRSFSIHREYRQALDERKGGRTSSFTPEDVLSNYLGTYFGGDLSNKDDFASELEVFLKETKELFTTGELKDGKYLTEDRIEELKEVTKEYYGTDNLTKFKKGSAVYHLSNVKKLNDEAEGRIGPIRKTVIKLEYTLDFNEKSNYKVDPPKTDQTDKSNGKKK